MTHWKPTLNDLFRPVAEVRIAFGWALTAGAAIVLALASHLWIHLIWVIPCMLLSAHWARRATLVYAFRMRLHAGRLLLMSAERLHQLCDWAQRPTSAPFEFSAGKTSAPSWWLGYGFEWQTSHATLAMEMLAADRSKSSISSAALARPLWRLQRFWDAQAVRRGLFYRCLQPWVRRAEVSLHGDTISDRAPVGQSFIHALEPDHQNVLFMEAAMPGHTLIVGAPGSGKTRLYVVLATQAIRAGTVTIVVDPKFDEDWERRLRIETVAAGRKYLYFNLAKLSQSVRLNPIKNWSLPSEIASRLTQLLEGDKSDPFVKFAFLSIDRAVNGMLFLGEEPTLRKIHQFVQRGVAPILEKALERILVEALGPNWAAQTQNATNGSLAASESRQRDSKGKPKSALDSMIMMYLDDPRLAAYRDEAVAGLIGGVVDYDHFVLEGQMLDPLVARRTQEVMSGLISSNEHNKEHYGKMILSLLPLLQMLCTGEVGDTLSPDPTDSDPRPVYDLRQVVEENGVIYLGLNTLANKTVGQAIGSILLAELTAVAGWIYNNIPEAERPRISLFVDEAAEVVNDQFIQILNKGRGAGFRTFFAVQTIADFEAEMGSKAKALQLLGNANNLICLRVQDMETVLYISKKFGETRISEQSVSSTQGTESDATALEFRGSVSYASKKKNAPKVHPDLLGRLPNLQGFAMLAGGTTYQFRIPIIH